MDRDNTFHDAKRLYLESCGDPMVTNTYLKIALALLSMVCVALALIDLRTIRTFQNFRPSSSASTIWAAPRRSTTTTSNTNRRMRKRNIFSRSFARCITAETATTIQNDFSKALFFLDGKLANGILDAYGKGDIIRKFSHQYLRPRDRHRREESRTRRDAKPAVPRSRRFLHGLLLARRP